MPALRFNGYNKEWMPCLLSVASYYLKDRKQAIKSMYVSTENMYQNCSGIVQYIDDSTVEGIAFDKNDILIANIRPYLKKAWKATFSGVCSSDVLALHIKKALPDFIYRIIENDDFFTYVMSAAKGSKMPRGDKQHIMNYQIALPCIQEQQKITDFLQNLDLRVIKQRQLINSLISYKRGVKNKFFDDFNNGWKKVPLSAILTERKAYCEKDGTYIHATLSKEGVSAKTERYDRDYLVSSDDKKYKITHYGDICYNPANLKFGVICLNTFGDAIFSPIYVTFEVDAQYNTFFIGEYLTRANFINKALQFQQGTVYEHMAVSPEDLLSMTIKVPSLAEQTRIAKCLRNYDLLIEKHDKRLQR